MQFILELILGPLSYAFMQRGLVAVVLVGIVSALIGTYVVLRGMAFFGDALAHAILPGLALGYLVNGGEKSSLFWWALVTAILSSFGIGAIIRTTRIREDTAIGIVFAGMFALGIAMISTVKNYAVDLSHFLFGNVLGVGVRDLWLTGILGALIILTILVFYKEFMVISFDPILATTLRLPARLLDNLLLILIAVTTVVALQVVGVALMVAMLVTPAATAYLLTKRLHRMMALAAFIASVSAIFGLYLSYYASIASGAAIVLTSTAVFLFTWGSQSLRQSIRARKAAG